MSETKTVIVQNSLSFGSILTLIFIALKLTHNIDWGWAWVLSPLWIPVAGWLAILLLYVVLFTSTAAVAALASKFKRKARKK